jgi:hypothetical protein
MNCENSKKRVVKLVVTAPKDQERFIYDMRLRFVSASCGEEKDNRQTIFVPEGNLSAYLEVVRQPHTP